MQSIATQIASAHARAGGVLGDALGGSSHDASAQRCTDQTAGGEEDAEARQVLGALQRQHQEGTIRMPPRTPGAVIALRLHGDSLQAIFGTMLLLVGIRTAQRGIVAVRRERGAG